MLFLIRKLAKDLMPKELAEKRKWYFKIHQHQNVVVKHGYFRGGYLQDVLSLSQEDEENLLRSDSTFIAKLVAVDIFGRLYGLKQPLEEVKNHVQEKIAMVVK